jgi:uncharacterized protein (TIGR02996 family)
MPAPIPDEQAALLAAIVAEPDEDTPRLVYADWLQEHGDEEHAQFIRDWIALEWLEGYEDEKRQRIAKRLNSIEARNGARWLAAIGVEGAEPVYDRGMVEGAVYTDFDVFLAEAPLLFSRVPVRELTVHGIGGVDLPDPLSRLAETRELAQLRSLRLVNGGCEVWPDGWVRFITSPHLAHLEALSVRGAALTDDEMRPFERCEHLANLEELDLSWNRITAIGSLIVVRSPHLANLKRIDLTENDIVTDPRSLTGYSVLREALINRFGTTSALGFVD